MLDATECNRGAVLQQAHIHVPLVALLPGPALAAGVAAAGVVSNALCGAELSFVLAEAVNA